MKDLVMGRKYSIKSVDMVGDPWTGIGTFRRMADAHSYIEGTGEFFCEDELVWNKDGSGFFTLDEILGEIYEYKKVDQSRIKPINSIKDLVVNKNYVVNSFEADGITPWNGVATCQGIADDQFPTGGCGHFICEDGVECAFEFNHILGELIEDPDEAILKEKNRCIQAVNDEPEFPDEMPDDMWAVISHDRDAASEFFRAAVRVTKAGIINRINNDQTPVNMDTFKE
jgi:hypothetical protein